ncbi:MAG: tetratricopeptide repeat protein [Thermodesulfobacteriota bacterium]
MTKNFNMAICLFFLLTSPLMTQAQTEIPEDAKQAMQNGIAAVDKAASLEDLDSAVKYFEQALGAAPQWAEACQNLARVLSMKPGREEEAIKRFQQYLEINPSAPDRTEILEEIKKIEAKLETIRDQNFLLRYIEFAALSDGIYVVGGKLSRIGFHQGDQILAINGKPTKGMTLAEFYRIMKEGPKDEFVCFQYVRPRSNASNHFGYKREALFDPNAPRRMSGKKNASGGYTNCIGGGEATCCK